MLTIFTSTRDSSLEPVPHEPIKVFKLLQILKYAGLDIKHLVYMPIGHMVLKMYVPCKNFHVPSQYLYKFCKAYVYCWKNKYMHRLKDQLLCRARNHKRLCGPGRDLHAPGKPWCRALVCCAWKCFMFEMQTFYWLKAQVWHGSTGTSSVLAMKILQGSVKPSILSNS